MYLVPFNGGQIYTNTVNKLVAHRGQSLESTCPNVINDLGSNRGIRPL